MRRTTIWLIVLVATCIWTKQVWAAQTVKGTMQSGTHQAITIVTDPYGKQQTIKPAQGAIVQRGQIGKQMRTASLLDFAPGDRVIAVVKQDGSASSIKAYYAVLRGIVSRVQGDKLLLRDGKSVLLKPGVSVVFGEGRLGTAAELRPGTMVLCRVNPSTQEAWTVVATEPAVVPVVPLIKPLITAVSYAGPSDLKVKDWIRVDLEGTAGARATCQIKGLIPVTVMNEISPGKYRAQVMIPGGKPVTDAALVGRLSIGEFEAAPVQAAKLITIEPMTLPAPEPQPAATVASAPDPQPTSSAEPPAVTLTEPKEPEPAPAAAEPEVNEAPTAPVTPAPAAPEPAAQPPAPVQPPAPEPAPVVPEPPKVKAPVALTAPANESKVDRAIVINGTAEPNSQVLVTVTYTNSQGGLLNISGQISSQLLAADAKGQFAMGPIPLEGPLATKGLLFTIQASYPDSTGQAAVVNVYGDRS